VNGAGLLATAVVYILCASSSALGADPPASGHALSASENPSPQDRGPQSGVIKGQEAAQGCASEVIDSLIPPGTSEINTAILEYQGNPLCRDRLFPALDKVFLHEQRDEQWAAALEARIKRAAADTGIQGLVVTGECHASLCRYDVHYNPNGQNMMSVREAINERIFAALDHSRYEIRDMSEVAPGGGYRSYFYSTINPLFFAPLRKEMESRAVTAN
jgi:hypothetical protein